MIKPTNDGAAFTLPQLNMLGPPRLSSQLECQTHPFPITAETRERRATERISLRAIWHCKVCKCPNEGSANANLGAVCSNPNALRSIFGRIAFHRRQKSNVATNHHPAF